MKKGFTLIELLVVVLIIGILAAVALPQYTKAVEKSRTAEAMQVLGDLATAESIYYMANGKYTANADNLDLAFPNKSQTTTANDTITTNSYKIVLTGEGSQAFTATATRQGGAYSGGTLTISVDANGAITRNGTLSGGSDNAGQTAIPSLAPQWK